MGALEMASTSKQTDGVKTESTSPKPMGLIKRDDNQLLKDEIEDLKADLAKLKKCVTCVICQDLLFEPYSLQCGHIFCYTCLLDWFQQKKTCPECRAVVDRQPASSYLVRAMIDTFVKRAELYPEDKGTDMEKLQQEAAAAVNRDKATEGKGRKGGLFQGLFTAKPRATVKYGIRDLQEGVLRCPDCIWEVVEGICEQCGERVRDRNDEDDMWSDMDDDDEEDEEDDDDESDDSSSSEDTGDGQYLFGVAEYDRARLAGRANNPITIDDDRESSARTNERGEFDDFDDEDDDIDDDHGGGSLGRPHYAFHVQISGNNAAAANRRIMDAGERRQFAEQIERDRMRQSGHLRHIHRNHISDDDSESDDTEGDDDDQGSLEDFIVQDDTPERTRRGRSSSTVATSSDRSSFTGNPTITIQSRERRRRIVISDDDDDEEDEEAAGDQSSVSEASSHPENYFAGASYSHRRGPIALSSDDEPDEEEDSLLGYTPLYQDTDDGYEDMNVDDSIVDGGFSPMTGHQASSSSVSRPANREVTFAVHDVSDDDDQAGNPNVIRVATEELSSPLPASSPPIQVNTSTGGAGSRRRRDSTPTTSTMARRTRRSIEIPSEITNTDSDEDEPVSRRPRRTVGNGVGGSDRNHSGSHHASSSTNSSTGRQNTHANNNNNRHSGSHRTRQTSNPFDRREIDPGISRMLQRHVQQRTENQFDHLARVSSSPARSITPVPVSPRGGGNVQHRAGGWMAGVATVGEGGLLAPPSQQQQQQQQAAREASVELLSVVGGLSGGSGGGSGVNGRGSGGATPVSASPRMGAGSRTGSGSQYSSSSPFPSNTLSEIAGLVSDPRGSARTDESQASRLRARDVLTTRPSAPVVTPPPPRTSVPRREHMPTIAATLSPTSPPASSSQAPDMLPSSSPMPAAQHHRPILHHHRDHNRAPTTLPPPGILSPSSRRLGLRNSRAGLRESNSRPNLRSSNSRNLIRSGGSNATPTSPAGQVTLTSPLNPNRTGNGTANSANGISLSISGSATPTVPVGARPLEDTTGLHPRRIEPRLPRYTPEEIHSLGASMINRRLTELLQLNAQNGGSSSPRNGRASHWRTSLGGTAAAGGGSGVSSSSVGNTAGENSSQISPHQQQQRLGRRGSRRDISQVIGVSGASGIGGGSGNGSANTTAAQTSPASPLSPLQSPPPPPQMPLDVTNSPPLLSPHGQASPGLPGEQAPGGAGTGTVGRRLGVGIGTGGPGGPMWIISRSATGSMVPGAAVSGAGEAVGSMERRSDTL